MDDSNNTGSGSAYEDPRLLDALQSELHRKIRYPYKKCREMRLEGEFPQAITYAAAAELLFTQGNAKQRAVGLWALSRCGDPGYVLPDGRLLMEQELLMESLRHNAAFSPTYNNLGLLSLTPGDSI